MTIVRIMGGLGNQLFQYAIGRAIALKRNDTLKLDATYFDEFKAHSGFRLKDFCVDAPLAAIKEIKRLAPRSRLLHRLARKGIFHCKKKSFCIEKREEESHFAPRVFNYGDVYLSGYFCNEGYFADIRSVLLDDLTLRAPISKATLAYLPMIQSSNGVAVHVRLSDALHDCYKLGKPTGARGGERKPMLSVEYYKNATQRAREIQNDPTFFVFSNDLKWCKANLRFIAPAVFVDQTQNELEDFELMRNCKHNIIANSTFSYWAAWLNANKNRRAIAPKIWFENWRGYDPCPSSWERV